MKYKILKTIPYLILISLSLIFLVVGLILENEIWKNIVLNLAANSIFVIILYFAYERIKAYIDSKEAIYIDKYIRNQIATDVFIVLYLLKKYIHGYNLETNTIQNIFSINNYSKKQIYSSIKNQSYLGFQIFKDMEDIKDLFKSVLNNNFIIKYSPREYVLNFLKIVDLIVDIENIFRNPKNYQKSVEKSIEFVSVNGTEINPNNEPSRFILIKKTQIENRFVVYDSGKFDQSFEKNLLNKYIIKEKAAQIVSAKIYELNKLLSYWLPDKFGIPRHNKSYRIIKNFFSKYTKAQTKSKRIYVADIVDIEKSK